ncbi:MAG TPA: hypothetical protein VF881_04225 [Polyangiaceae bacterium]
MGRHPSEGWVLAAPYPMRPFTRRAFRGLIRAICPPDPAPQLVDLEDRIEDHLRRLLRYMLPHVAFGFCLAVIVLDWAPIWRFKSLRRIQHMRREEAADLLSALGASRSMFLRTLLLGVRGSILSTYYDQDEVHAALAYAPVAFIADRIDLRRRVLREEATAQDRSSS